MKGEELLLYSAMSVMSAPCESNQLIVGKFDPNCRSVYPIFE